MRFLGVRLVDSCGFRPFSAVFEHERNDPDDGLDFDFFDDSPTTEATREGAGPVRSRTRPRLPGRPPGGPGGTPLLRLGGLIAGAILLAVVLVLWVNACREDAKRSKYESYMEAAAAVATDSAEIGNQLNQLIFSSGIQLEDLQTQLDGLREAQSQTVRRAEQLDAPGPLREQQESLVEALQLRVSGLIGLSRAFSQISGTAADSAQQAGADLAKQSERLVASDVVYEDFFQARAQEVMDQQGIRGVAVPASDFVTNADLASPSSWTQIVNRIIRPPTQGGLRGNNIAGVKIQPGDQQLSQSEENTCKVSDDLAFDVTVENSGESQETQVKVRLTIEQSPAPIKQEQTIQSINPGETKIVTFTKFGTPQFTTRTIVRVVVEPVPGESNKANNSAEYVCFFTIS
jgi:hypothetical protein